MELPEGFLEDEWPFPEEVALLRRAQAMHAAVDDKLRRLTRDFRAHRLHPRRIETRRLQLHVHHTFTPPVEGSEETPGTPGEWTLHLRAVDAGAADPKTATVNLASFFRKISIELDPRLYSDSVVEWTCFQKGNQEVQGLTVTRTGHTPHDIRIKMLPSHPMERYVLSDELARAIGGYLGSARAHTKPDIIMATWEYIKRRNLIKEDDCRVAVCDATLGQLFNCESLPFTSIVVALRPHLTAAPTGIDLEYKLSLEGDHATDEPLDPREFDVDVGYASEVERSRDVAMGECEELQREHKKELELLAQQEEHIVKELETYYQKYQWMRQFALDPAGFTAHVVRSQQADQVLLTSESETDEVSIPHPYQFSQPWVREIVSDLLIVPPSN